MNSKFNAPFKWSRFQSIFFKKFPRSLEFFVHLKPWTVLENVILWAYRRFCWFWRCGSYWRTEAFSHAALALHWEFLGPYKLGEKKTEPERSSSSKSLKEKERDLYSEISSAFTRNWWLPMNISWSEGLCSWVLRSLPLGLFVHTACYTDQICYCSKYGNLIQSHICKGGENDKMSGWFLENQQKIEKRDSNQVSTHECMTVKFIIRLSETFRG